MLSRINRLTKESDFAAIYKHGKRFSGSLVMMYVRDRKDASPSRFGFVVSTKISKKATVRNRIKRIMREVIGNKLGDFGKGLDCVFVYRAGFEYDKNELAGDVEGLLGKINNL